jgi:2-C-methyl-D-erythritol 2,4-cyclodiphosphate synthase
LIAAKGYKIGNLDVTVSAQKPKLKPFIPEMEETLAKLLNIDVDNVSIKATTTEQLGFEGREEGISVHAVVLLEKIG